MSHLQKLELTTNLTPNYHDYYSWPARVHCLFISKTKLNRNKSV